MSDTELRKQLQQAIQDSADRLHNAQEWWDGYYANSEGKTVGDRLIDRVLELVKQTQGTAHE